MINTLGLLVALLSLPQINDWTEISSSQFTKTLEAGKENYVRSELAFTIRYSSYAGKESSIEVDAYTVAYKKKNDFSYSKADDQIIAQDGDMRVVVDLEQKVIILSEPIEEDLGKMGNSFYESALTSVKQFYKRQNENSTQLKLVFKEGMQLTEQEIELDSRNRLVKVVSIYSRKERLSESDASPLVNPKLEMQIHGYLEKTEIAENEKPTFFVEKNGLKFSGIGAYKNYEIIEYFK